MDLLICYHFLGEFMMNWKYLACSGALYSCHSQLVSQRLLSGECHNLYRDSLRLVNKHVARRNQRLAGQLSRAHPQGPVEGASLSKRAEGEIRPTR